MKVAKRTKKELFNKEHSHPSFPERLSSLFLFFNMYRGQLENYHQQSYILHIFFLLWCEVYWFKIFWCFPSTIPHRNISTPAIRMKGNPTVTVHVSYLMCTVCTTILQYDFICVEFICISKT